MRILITGGAGFIGTHLCRRLLKDGHSLRVLDNLQPQVHGDDAGIAADLDGHVELIVGDVRDRSAWRRALIDREVVVHLAAETGTGQSMYEAERYSAVNLLGTSILCDILAAREAEGVQRLVLASSRAVYGEGAYLCGNCGTVFPRQRRLEDLKRGAFEPRCPSCCAFCEPVPTLEQSPLQPNSFYGLTKQGQEQMIILFAQALGLPAVALRFQNVYGPGQSLRNPYTGILAIFSNQARANLPINIFEDGMESRDFVYVDDAVDAICHSLVVVADDPLVLNIGGGKRVNVLQVVQEITSHFKSTSDVSVSGDFRLGDIRHNLADLSNAKMHLGYSPQWTFDRGVRKFLDWAAGEPSHASAYARSMEEMTTRRLLLGK